jgi:hypothetical protein
MLALRLTPFDPEQTSSANSSYRLSFGLEIEAHRSTPDSVNARFALELSGQKGDLGAIATAGGTLLGHACAGQWHHLLKSRMKAK